MSIYILSSRFVNNLFQSFSNFFLFPSPFCPDSLLFPRRSRTATVCIFSFRRSRVLRWLPGEPQVKKSFFYQLSPLFSPLAANFPLELCRERDRKRQSGRLSGGKFCHFSHIPRTIRASSPFLTVFSRSSAVFFRVLNAGLGVLAAFTGYRQKIPRRSSRRGSVFLRHAVCVIPYI